MVAIGACRSAASDRSATLTIVVSKTTARTPVIMTRASRRKAGSSRSSAGRSARVVVTVGTLSALRYALAS
jgi:hypothetical protein